MATKCPRCKNKVSETAKTCIFCGSQLNESVYQIPSNNVYQISVHGYDKRKALESVSYLHELTQKSFSAIERELKNYSDNILDALTYEQAIQVRDTLLSMGVECEAVESKLNYVDIRWNKKNLNQQVDNTLKCPRCGSEYIAIGSRGVTLTSGFFGASKTMNRCGKCGYKWKPRL